MNALSPEQLEIYWKNYHLGQLMIPEHLDQQVGEFIRGKLAGKAIKEREQAAACFYAYLAGYLRPGTWLTPGEWERENGRELSAPAMVWIRWRGSEAWEPGRWGEAKAFSTGTLEVLVSRGPEEPPRPPEKQLKAERRGIGREG